MEIMAPPSAVFTGAPKPKTLQQVDALASIITQTTSEYQLLDGWPEPHRADQRKATAQNLLSVAEQLHALTAEFADSETQESGQSVAEQ